MAGKGGTAAAVKVLETLLREHRWAKALELLGTGLSARQLRGGASFVVDGRQREVLAALLAAGADANRDYALYRAVKANWREGVEMLLAHGVDPGHGPSIDSPLHTAMAHHNDALGALLVRHGAPLLNPVTRQPLLLRAVHLGLVETVRAMLAAGADPNTRGLLRKTADLPGSLMETVYTLFGDAPALVIAAAGGRREIVEALVEAGADVDLHDDHGRTALAAARQASHAEVAAFLEERGASERARLSPAEELFGAIEARDLTAVQQLLAAGVSPDTPDPRGLSSGRPPLATAVVAAWPELLDALLAAGADVDRRDSDEEHRMTVLGIARPEDLERERHRRGMTALMYAALLDRADLARRLLAAGARTDPLDFTRHSALMLAAGNGHTAAVEALLAGGADPDLRGAERATALHLAAGDNHTAAALALVGAGADPELRDSAGNTAAALARLLENRALMNTIERAAEERPRRRPARTRRTTAAEPEADTGSGVNDVGAPPSETPSPPATIDLARYDTEAVRARCREAAGPELLALAGELGRRLGVEPNDQRHEDGRVELHLPTTLTIDLGALQREALERGCFLFACQDHVGRPSRLALLPTTDPLEAVAHVGVGEAGVEDSNGAVIAWLASLHEPWQVTTITYDTLAGRFLAPPADPQAIAESIYRICSDAVHQGAGDLETLAADLAATAAFYLWWD